MKILIQITLMTFLLFFSNCSKLDRKNHKQKETLLIATQNFNYIKEVKKDVVCFGRGMEVPLSRKYHDQIKELHLDKIRRAYKEQELNYN